jgi:hypothetical protein
MGRAETVLQERYEYETRTTNAVDVLAPEGLAMNSKFRDLVRRRLVPKWLQRITWNREYATGQWDSSSLNVANDPLYQLLAEYCAGRDIPIKILVMRAVMRLMPHWAIKIIGYTKLHGELPNVLRPKTFNEKIIRRDLYDRRPIFSQIADKYAVRSYVEQRVGRDILTKVYYLTEKPDTIPFDELPDKFVVKPTHGSGWVKIVTDKVQLDRSALLKQCHAWMRSNYYKEMGEMVYRNIPPRIMIEEFINDGSGTAPTDYKFFVFRRKIAMIQVDATRFTDHRRNLYTTDWEWIDVLYSHKGIDKPVERPALLQKMLATAEALGREFDFIRVDLYATSDRVYFGELTATPEGGLARFTPKEYDRYLGDMWRVGA